MSGVGFDGTGGKFWFTGYIPLTSRINLSINNAMCSYKVSGIPNPFTTVTYIGGCRNANNNGQFFLANNASGQTLQRTFVDLSGALSQADQNGIFANLSSNLANWPTGYTNSARTTRERVSVLMANKADNLETLLTNRELTILAMNVNGTITTGGTPVLGFFSLGKCLNTAELTADPSNGLEFIRAVNDIPKGTYLSCI